jgi:transcription initiation factor TFIIIB Brf1 subunit/transcription initiation factor TFIIB
MLPKASLRIKEIAYSVTGLHDVHISAGIEVYKIALDEGQTKGRPADHVAAACLYIACRQQGTPRKNTKALDVTITNTVSQTCSLIFLKQ